MSSFSGATWQPKNSVAQRRHTIPPPSRIRAPTGRGRPTDKLALPPGVDTEYDSDLDGSQLASDDDGEHERQFVPHPDDIHFTKHSEVQDFISMEGAQESKGVELSDVDVVGVGAPQETDLSGGDGEGGGGSGASVAAAKRSMPLMERMMRVTPGWFFELASISISLANNPRYSTYAGPEHAQAKDVHPL